ncbi:PorT family protein [Prevotella sp. PINT]|uniref:porin family protein n=1 Tax=Palleniella intestinalis TaxID=2736291 RepID=UPI0015536436|nr:porin family protein [Palleniella intestinalis]NPD82579.1 PorT family protein [Palleniella intestinalis]
MKKLILLAAIIMTSVGAHAQHEVGSVTIQPKVGMNIASLTKAEGADSRIGLAIGAEAEYQIEDRISLSAGLLYSMQGATESEDGVDATLKLDYINIPILANIYVTKGLAFKVGVQPGINVSGKYKLEKGGSSISEDTDGVKAFDFSIPVGASYEFNNLVLDARYNWGLTKVSKYANSKNSVFQITLGYKFKM